MREIAAADRQKTKSKRKRKKGDPDYCATFGAAKPSSGREPQDHRSFSFLLLHKLVMLLPTNYKLGPNDPYKKTPQPS
jgi:hypothetical protein